MLIVANDRSPPFVSMSGLHRHWISDEIALCYKGFWIVPAGLVQRQEFLEVRPCNQALQKISKA